MTKMEQFSNRFAPANRWRESVFIACTAILLLPLVLTAQFSGGSAFFSHLTTENGLSNSRVRTFLQDSTGFIWIGTEGGLNRYGACNFSVFKQSPGNTFSINNNSIPAILEDRRKNFWVGSKEGLQLMDRDKNIFFPGRTDNENPLKDIGAVLSLYEDSRGNIWVGTTAGLFRLDIRATEAFSKKSLQNALKEGQLQVTHFSREAAEGMKLSHNQVWSITEDHKGKIWIGTGRGLNILDPATGTLQQWLNNDDSLEAATINTLVADRAGFLWVGTANGLYRIKPDRRTTAVFRASVGQPNGLSNNFITKIVQDRQGNIWIGSDGGGLDLWRPETGTFIHHRHDPSNPGSLSDNNIEALYADRNGGLWVGSHKGISYLNKYRKPFHYYRNTGVRNALTPGTVTCFWERPDGKIWIGIDDGGMDLFDRHTGVFTHFRHLPGNSQSICNDDVVAICEDRRGEVWIGTWSGGLSRLTPRGAGGVYTHYFPDGRPGSIGDNDIWTFFEDGRGTIWIGTVDDGLNRYDRATDTFRSFRWKSNNQSSLFRNWVFDICEDPKGNIWIATADGISRLDQETGEFVAYPVPGQGKMDRVYVILPNPSGGFWLGTDNGLLAVDPERQTTKKWQEQDGLADNLVNSILEDGRGNLWLGTGKGISVFNPGTGLFRNFDARDGLQSGGFSGACLKSASGVFFFGGINGFNVFHPDSIRDNPVVPRVVITDFMLYGKSVPVQGTVGDTLSFDSPLHSQIFNLTEITLPYWQNDLSFEFSALNYLSPEKNQFRYQLEGYADQWITAEPGRNFANYTGLDPGTYTFRVTGSNNDGVWDEKGATLRITITPPWWKTWWAYSLFSVAISALLYFSVRYELRRQQLKHALEMEHLEAEQLKELDKTKSRLYANITHEFRTPLTVILGMTEQLDKEVGKLEDPQSQKSAPDVECLHATTALIHRNGSQLLTLVNQMLDLSKLESNRMEIHNIQGDIVAYVKYITESFHSLAEAKDLSIRVCSTPESINMDYDPSKIMHIVSNLLSNAIKFTMPGGEIAVQLSEEQATNDGEKYAVLVVSDTGVGIAADQLPHIFDRFYQAPAASRLKEGVLPPTGSGIGLALVRELVKLFNGRVDVESAAGEGTRFTVRLPIHRDAPAGTSTTTPMSPDLIKQRPGHITGFSRKDAAPASEDLPLLLVIEDNPDVMTFLISCLEDHYRIETAINGRVGVEKGLELVPDIIISDVMMPEMDGFEVCDTLKKDSRTSHIPIVMLTARATVEDHIAGMKRGADAYMAKPFHQGELTVQLENLLESRRRLQERYRSLDISVEEASPHDKAEDAFLIKLRGFIEAEINDADLSIDDLCRKMAMSRMQLHRKIKALTDRSTALYIRSIRLQRARHLLTTSDINVSEAAYQVGFDDPKYFSRVFIEEFGMAPSEMKSNPAK